MKIVVNFRMVKKDNLTGISFFTKETFTRIAEVHPEHTFYFVFDEDPPEEYAVSSNIILKKVSIKARFRAPLLWLWFEVFYARLLRRINPDIVIAPDALMSLSVDYPTIIAAHDLNFEHYPEFMPKGVCRFYQRNTPKYFRKAKRIVAVSEFTKNDVVQTYQISPEKIDVVYSGYNGGFKPVSTGEKAEIQEQYANGKPFFIFVGSIHPRKNLINQLKAFDLYRKQNPEEEHKFLVIGTPWIWRKEDKEVLENLGYKNDILFLGRIPDKELREITASAEALMYVSVFEGFGLPILEGFYSEIPVITADVSAMPEIAGNAAICVNPLTPQEIANVMTKVVKDKEFRENLIELGRQRKTLFSWDNTADLVWNSIEKEIVLKGK